MMHHYETLVIGGGPAGIAAAVSAAEHGARVALIDDNPRIGGQIWRSTAGLEVTPKGNAGAWQSRMLATQMTRWSGWSVVDHLSENENARAVLAERSGQVLELRYDKLILATGARERFLPFPGWTLPNVMGVGAIQAMMKGGLPMRGKRIVIAGSGPLLLAVAAALKAAGARVLCICEQAPVSQLLPFALSLTTMPAKIIEALRYKASTLDVPFHSSSWPISATGDNQLRAVTLSIHGHLENFDCDYMACAYHLVPNIELPSLMGCAVAAGVVVVDQEQRTSVPTIYCAGEPTGIGGVELSLIEGQIAGLVAAGQKEEARSLFTMRHRYSHFASKLEKAFTLRQELKALPQQDTLICRCEDVTYSALQQQSSSRAAKLHTRCGMGPCQGRICGTATDFLLGWNMASVRPPALPVSISSIAYMPSKDGPTTHSNFEVTSET